MLKTKSSIETSTDTSTDDLIWQIMLDNEAKVRAILNSKKEIINNLNKHGELPLNKAIRDRRNAMIHLLFSHDNLDINAKDARNITPLQEAAFQDDLITVQKLISMRAEMKSFINGLSPLHIAIWKEHYDIADYVLEQGAEVDSICTIYPGEQHDQHDVTPLHCAAMGGDIDFIYLLASYNVDENVLTREGYDAKTLFCSIHAEKTFQIDGEELSPFDAFEKTFERGRLFFTQNAAKKNLEPVKKLALFSSSLTSPKGTQASTELIEIKGELLTSFNEIILELIENIIEIKDEKIKRLYLHMLFNGNLSCKVVAKCSADLDRVIGEQFSILYCCLYPNKWQEPYMSSYKKFVIDSYVERSSESGKGETQLLKENWLMAHAKKFAEEVFAKNNLLQIELTEEESGVYQQLLSSLSSNLEAKIGA